MMKRECQNEGSTEKRREEGRSRGKERVNRGRR